MALITLSIDAADSSTYGSDDWLYIDDDGDCESKVGEAVEDDLSNHFAVSSGSTVTVAVSGLPTGVSYDKKSSMFKGKTSKKGVYYVTCSAKNKNGYTMSDTIRWIVGDASEGDYDDIGLWEWCEEDELENLQVGTYFSTCGYYVSSVSGLPTGLKWTKGSICSDDACTVCSDFIMGTPTKPGKFKITFTDEYRKKTVKTVIVRDGYSGYLDVQPGANYAGRGTASGGGVKHAGATVKLTAKPKKGSYFAGWYTDEECTQAFEGGNSGDYRTSNESFVFSGESTALYAKFISKSEDADISIDADDTWGVDTEFSSDYFYFDVESLTMPKVTAKGLPTGVKLSGTELVISDTSKLKPGTSLVTLTAKNLSGATATKTLKIVVPNLQSDVFEDLDYEGSYAYTVGESTVCRASDICSYEDGWTITASGVPAGLKFSAKNGICGLSGMATKAGVYTVTLTAKKGSQTEKATFTVTVAAFPTELVGSYGGDIGYDLESVESEDDIGYDVYAIVGTFSMTIAKDGKISVKFPMNGKSVSLSGYSCCVNCTGGDEDEAVTSVDLSDTKGNWCSLNVYPQRGLGTYQVEGSFGDGDSDWSALGQRNVAKSDSQMKTMVTKLAKIGKIYGLATGGDIECPNCIALPSDGKVSPNVSFTVGSDGVVKASGKIDGRSVSGSALLQVLEMEDDYLLYADFYDYKTGKGLLTYRAVFSWSWIRDYNPSGSGALYYGSYYSDSGAKCCKPVIYLYPGMDTVCRVRLSLAGSLTCTYPDYGQGWDDFQAAPDGTLTFADGQQYYCLYWEGQMRIKWDFSQGYCVKGTETASFLADILLQMGLTFREANEFIIYWLPLMQDNPYNVIAFQGANYAKAAELEIEPQPDSVLRIFMAWKPSQTAVAIEAPDIIPFERKGFTAVEWGGTKVGD